MQEEPDYWDEKEPDPEKPDWIYVWFAERKIGARVVDQYGAAATRWTFDPAVGEVDAIALPLTSKGEIANRVFYARKGVGVVLEHPKVPAVFNGAAFLSGEPIVWCSGELDVLALAEVGISGGVSSTRLDALGAHADMISAKARIVLAYRDDKLGIAQREEMARRLGRHRVWLATTSAFDLLTAEGPDAVLASIQDAAPYPIEGIHRVKPGTLARLRSMPPPGLMTTGTAATDAILKLPAEGRLIVVTGLPNHGKTNWTRFVMVHTASRHSRKWCVFSPESQPWEQFASECAEVYSGKPFYEMDRIPSMTNSDIAEAEAFLSDKVTLLVCDAETDAPTLDWLLERARACVLRDGTTDFLIDPWNEVDQERGTSTETDFIGKCLQRLKAFALRHGCNVWIVAHPAKPLPTRGNDKRLPPGPYDIAGSSHWANRTDLGMTIHSPGLGSADLIIWKSRMRRWASRDTVASMNFDKLCGQYSTPAGKNDLPSDDDLLRGEWGVQR